MEWNFIREGNFDTYALQMKDATLKVVTAKPNGSFDDCIGIVVLNERGALPVFDKENNNAYGPLEKIKQMTIKTYKNKEIALEARRNEKHYGSLIFQ